MYRIDDTEGTKEDLKECKQTLLIRAVLTVGMITLFGVMMVTTVSAAEYHVYNEQAPQEISVGLRKAH